MSINYFLLELYECYLVLFVKVEGVWVDYLVRFILFEEIEVSRIEVYI